MFLNIKNYNKYGFLYVPVENHTYEMAEDIRTRQKEINNNEHKLINFFII